MFLINAKDKEKAQMDNNKTPLGQKPLSKMPSKMPSKTIPHKSLPRR